MVNILVTHKCNKETEIKEILEMTHSQESRIQVMQTKIDDMHKALMGNGRPGLIENFTTWKSRIIGGIAAITFFLTTAISVLAIIK